MRDIEKYEKEYASTEFEQKYQVVYRRRKILETIHNYEHYSILEVGCGLDSIGKYINDYEAFTIVEPGELFLEYAKTDLGERENTFFIHGFCEKRIEELKKRHYDIIIISSLLHEIETPVDFLQSIKKICDKNTIIHLNVPNAYSLHRILAYESGIIDDVYESSARNVVLQQNTIFSMEKLKCLIEKVGGTIIEQGSYFIKPFTHQQMDSCLIHGIFDEQILEGFYKLEKYLPDFGSEIYVNFKFESV